MEEIIQKLEEIETKLLSEGLLHLIDEYTGKKYKCRCKTLKSFISSFFNYLNYYYVTYRDTEYYCDSDRNRSLGDVFRICKYYFPDCTLKEVTETVWNSNINTLYCNDILKRVYFSNARGTTNLILNTDTRDEFGILGIFRKRKWRR